VHLADRFELPDGYAARPYRGLDDLPAMHAVLVQYREHIGDPERPTLDQMRATYTHLTESDPERDIALVHAAGQDQAVAYCRPNRELLSTGVTDCVAFAPIVPAHLHEPLFVAMVIGQERHMLARSDPSERIRFRAYAGHPGPDQPATGEAAWLEQLGYVATEWGASLRRPNLDDVPDLPLPDGVEVRPVQPDQVRRIWEVHYEAFRGEWDFREWEPADIDRWLDDPVMDPTLWQVAWAGDEIVGQVKPFINVEENAARGYRRGYTEFISTHRDWRNRGIASALLARSLVALRERGITEAVLGVDTNNPGGAFHVYTQLGFQLESYQAVYAKPATPSRV
jgi:ribosomal protein S18 acetylase RimI-like enzyme